MQSYTSEKIRRNEKNSSGLGKRSFSFIFFSHIFFPDMQYHCVCDSELFSDRC